MFESFFPKPKYFFLSGAIIGIISMIIWYYFKEDIGIFLGLPFRPEDAEPLISLKYFITNNFITFYIYFGVIAGLWSLFWLYFYPHPWQNWSVFGSLFIVFMVFIVVQANVVINNWQRIMYDLIQMAITGEGDVTEGELMGSLADYLFLVLPIIVVLMMRSFIISHYIFRWRTAMTDFYTAKWPKLRQIEGASQRVQEDTMRFASTMEGIGVSILDAVLTLFTFLPILNRLSENISSLPIIGEIPNPLVWAAVLWAVFGTVLMVVAGIRLPGLEFNNQRVEAAYRKELVYGEDDPSRAEPAKLKELFAAVRLNYFRLYFNYLYFNIVSSLYARVDIVFSIFILIPSIIAKKLTFGLYTQIASAFSNVAGSFQLLVSSWSTIIELISIYKRLKAFEKAGQDIEMEEKSSEVK